MPEAPAPRALNPAWAGGCASPVPLHAAQALLRRRLLRGEGCAELSPALSQNYTCVLVLWPAEAALSHALPPLHAVSC